jgi:hypothetical protein
MFSVAVGYLIDFIEDNAAANPCPVALFQVPENGQHGLCFQMNSVLHLVIKWAVEAAYV